MIQAEQVRAAIANSLTNTIDDVFPGLNVEVVTRYSNLPDAPTHKAIHLTVQAEGEEPQHFRVLVEDDRA